MTRVKASCKSRDSCDLRYYPYMEVYLMTAKQKLHQAHLREWAARFSDQKSSGLTVRQWCEQNQVSIHKYNYWKHILKEEVVDQMLPDIVPVSFPVPSAPNHAVRTNRAIRANSANSNVKLCIDGVSVEIDPAVPEDFLRTLVRAVHYA